MKRGDLKLIQVDGKEYPAIYLGCGRYCRAFLVEETVYCFVRAEEHMKECVSMWCDSSPHIPPIERHDPVNGVYTQVYSMPYYRNIQASDKEAWEILKTLQKAHSRAVAESPGSIYLFGADINRKIINLVRTQIPDSVVEALENLADAACNYGCGVLMEFGRRNIGVDSEGRIVFRDVLFDAEKLNRQKRRRNF